MTFREMRKKQVIQLENGVCLGRVDDVVFNPENGIIESFVMFGRPHLFGLFGREEDLCILRGDIQSYGQDALLVNTPLPESAQSEWKWPWKK